MDSLQTIVSWVAGNEGFFSGLVAIAALFGILGALSRLIWVRLQGLKSTGRTWSVLYTLGAFAIVGFTALLLLPEADDALPEDERASRSAPLVAVLPFTNIAGSTDHDLLAQGIASDVVTLLAQSSAIQVVATHATVQFKQKVVDVNAVRDALGVDFIVSGNFRPIGDRLRVNVQLIDARTGTNIWAEHYDRPLKEIFFVQDELATGIAAALGDEVFRTETIRAVQAKSDSLDAWQQTWLADASWNIDDARKAVQLDPQFARALAVLGRNLSLRTLQSTRDPELIAEAVAAARRAAELAPGDPIVLTHLGATLLWSGDPVQSLSILEQVPIIAPSYAEGWTWYADALVHNGRAEESLAAAERAIALTPKGRMLWVYEVIRAEALIHLGRFEAAKPVLQRAHLNDPAATSAGLLAGIAALEGDKDSAREYIARARAVSSTMGAKGLRDVYEFISTDRGGEHFIRLFDELEATVP